MKKETTKKITNATAHAREKHPDFAVNIHHAMCLAQEELGEVAKAINDMRDWQDIEAEIYDTIAVLVRMAEKDHLKMGASFQKCAWRVSFKDAGK